MSSSILSAGNTPSLDLGGFQFGVVTEPPARKLVSAAPPTPETEPKLGVLGLLENKTFKGQGYNCIFRPRSNKPLDNKQVLGNPAVNFDNDLQLNLTTETIAFSGSIGKVPNRGLTDQEDILLGGITYLDLVNDVTDETTGEANLEKPGTGIHVEPGCWMFVPASSKFGAPKDTICRMASIPHGTTINAQGLHPSLEPVAGEPTFDEADITPFFIRDKKPQRFNNMDFDFTPSQDEDGNDLGNNRIPQNLEIFKSKFVIVMKRVPLPIPAATKTDVSAEKKTITPDILKDPNQVLRNAIKDQKIVNFIKFDVTTDQTNDFGGGGTANISFLGGLAGETQKDNPKPNALPVSMKATFWIETVEYSFSVEGGKSTETVQRPAGEFGPTFKVPPTVGHSKPTRFTVNYTQLQYSQTVLLNFMPLSWPHVSVATLVEQTTFNLVLPYVETPPLPPEQKGCWGPVFDLQNVAAHASLLPTGKVLYWGRRADWKSRDPLTMSEHFTNTFLWDPLTGDGTATATKPTLQSHPDKGTNLFCSGHCFQPDGSLFVAGGHLQDFHGTNQASIYNPFEDTWTAQDRMNYGRWYPSALTLNDGSIYVQGGSFYDDTYDEAPQNAIPQIWRDNHWVSMPRAPMLDGYPRLHLDPSSRVFVAGTQAQAEFLDVNADKGVGIWTDGGPKRHHENREFGPSVMYDNGKIMYIGGGGGPTNAVEFIDFTNKEKTPEWSVGANMKFKRRHHNGTVLPDGSVLVTGGTEGDGFNDVAQAVHTPELYDPFAKSPQWTEMAEEAVDRCYHSIALLLPDGRVLSAGGGEWAPDMVNPNKPEDSHADAQLFQPPYLFKGTRPTVSNAPNEISFDEKFEVTVGVDDSIAKVSWIRLGSATHACNMSQSLTFLTFQQEATKVNITAPAPGKIPPGYYMLFLLNRDGVPSIAPIIRIGASGPISINLDRPDAHFVFRTARPKDHALNLPSLNDKIAAQEGREPVAVGLTSICPYGLGPCWGGAFAALQRIKDIDVVRPVPDHDNSIGFVYLHEDVLPDIDVWQSEFEKVAHQSYDMRGIDMTISGLMKTVETSPEQPPQLIMAATPARSEVVLAPFQESSNLKWDRVAKASKPITEAEANAFTRLVEATADVGKDVTVQVTGRLHKNGGKFSLDVRDFKVPNQASGVNVNIPNGA
jgi:galactose oxidase